MAHELQERYSKLVLAKLRQELVLKDDIVFNNSYEGDPTAGAVKIPVRDTEVAVSDYDKANGITATTGSTSYVTLTIDKDKAVNEIIDGYDAASVPDNLVADRLDSAGYSLAETIDEDGATVLLAAATVDNEAAITKDNVYDVCVDLYVSMSENHVPKDGRYLLATPAFIALLLKSDQFTHASALGDEVIKSGAIGAVAGFASFAVEQRIGEARNMARRDPRLRVHDDGRVKADVVRAFLHEFLQPGLFDVVFELNA